MCGSVYWKAMGSRARATYACVAGDRRVPVSISYRLSAIFPKSRTCAYSTIYSACEVRAECGPDDFEKGNVWFERRNPQI